MFKRVLGMGLALVVVCLAGCGKLPGNNDTTQDISPLQSMQSNAEMEVILQQLVNNNIFVRKIFIVSSLSMDENQRVRGTENSYYVNDARISTYAALEKFLNDTYVDTTAQELLHLHPENADKPLYFEQDGRLCVNKDLVQTAAPEDAWTGYTIQIKSNTAAICRFTVRLPRVDGETAATTEEDTPNREAQKATISMTAMQDAGSNQWKLDRVYSLEDIAYETEATR